MAPRGNRRAEEKKKKKTPVYGGGLVSYTTRKMIPPGESSQMDRENAAVKSSDRLVIDATRKMIPPGESSHSDRENAAVKSSGAHYVCDVLHDGKIVPFPIVPEVSKTKAESKNENVSELRISHQLKVAIKKAREAKNLSQAQFAEMIQETKLVVKEHEYGHPILNHKIISKMATALGAKLSGPISNERTSVDIEKSIDTGNLTLGQLAQVIKPPVIKEKETDKAIRLLEIRSKMKARLEEAQLAGSIGKGKPQQELFGIEIPVADAGVSELKK